ncbi:hypothetical protein BJ973_001210 [Actinoplanes tereljensis]|uniref:Uncharacterized protein n=1 Tax=Paractinoplanes tereljensis TaxID=571912 RepID=A0A919TS08_9ACTN|nr:hypothetical protein [Actinoplanes tereljensis]GIF20883.1 hypothetical protein Ate02nite_36130 [Actinoplanes tereljensis]
MTQQTDLTDVLSELEAGSAERESAAERPHDVVDRLRGTGFLTLRVPGDQRTSTRARRAVRWPAAAPG